MDQAQQRLVELYPANVRKYVVLATVNALILMVRDRPLRRCQQHTTSR